MFECEPCQVGNEAALSKLRHVCCRPVFLKKIKTAFIKINRSKELMMRKICMIAIILLSACFAFAGIAEIQSTNLTSDVKLLNNLKLDIDRVSHLDSTIFINLRSSRDLNLIKQAGFEPIIRASESFGEGISSERVPRGSSLPDAYLSYDAFEDYIHQIHIDNLDICTLESIGNSLQYRDIYYLKFSNNPMVSQPKVKIKLISNIHGDEPIGYYLLLKLIELFTLGYGSDPRITNLIDNSEIFIMPLMNPDGYVNHVRYNANNVDLNRNFPMPDGTQNPDGNAYQPETLAMIDWSNANNFSLGLSMHTGSLVMNYPWDYSYGLTPDEQLLRELSLAYSVHNTPMYNSHEFEDGVVNGAQWYVITGSMQDWNYAFTSNLEITAELGYTKWPPAATLPGYWDDNKESILSYIEYALKGVKGIISSVGGGTIAAKVSSFGAAKEIFNDPANGDYHQILLPGDYRLMASADGYFPQIVSLSVPEEGYITQDFTLEPAEVVSPRGIVRDAAGLESVAGAEITLWSDEEISVLSGDEGSFFIPVIDEGIYPLKAEHDSDQAYLGHTAIKKYQGETLLSIPLFEPLFYDDFEAGAGNWSLQGNWGITSDGGSMVLTDSPAGNYSGNQNVSATTMSPIDLTNVYEAQLGFRTRWDLESGYDFVFLEASTDNTNWKILDSFTGSQSTYVDRYYDLSAYAGSQLRLRFRLKTDYYVNRDGIYIDDIRVIGKDESLALIGDVNSDGCWNSQDLGLLVELALEADESGFDAAADLDGNGEITAVDAYYLLRFLKDPGFALPALDPQSAGLQECEISIATSEESFVITLPQELRSLSIDLGEPVADISFTHQDETIYSSVNHDNSRMIIIREKDADYEPMDIVFHHSLSAEGILAQVEVNGVSTEMLITLTSVQDDGLSPMPTMLLANYPNPFNPETTLSFQLAYAQDAELSIHNLKGQKVRSLHSGMLKGGVHSYVFDGYDDGGKALGSGIYFYTLKTKDIMQSKKMILCK